MANFSSIVLLPFFFAFIIYIFRFYTREAAASMRQPSFLFAAVTVLFAACYLVLRITDSLPPYSLAGFGLIGIVLLGIAVRRLFLM